MQNSLLIKGIVIGIVVLFIGASITLSITIMVSADDPIVMSDLSVEVYPTVIMAGMNNSKLFFNTSVVDENDVVIGWPEDAGLIVRIFNESGFDVTGSIGNIGATDIDGKANRTLYNKFIQKPGTYTVFAYNDTHNSNGRNATFEVKPIEVVLEELNGVQVSFKQLIWMSDDNVSATFSVKYDGEPVNGMLRIDNMSAVGSGISSYNKTWINTSFTPVIGSTTGVNTGGNVSKSITVTDGVVDVCDVTPDYLPEEFISRNITFYFKPSEAGSAWAKSDGKVLVKMPDVSASPSFILYNKLAELKIMVTGRGIPIENILVNLTIPGLSSELRVRTDSEGKTLFAFTPPTSGFVFIKIENKTSLTRVIVSESTQFSDFSVNVDPAEIMAGKKYNKLYFNTSIVDENGVEIGWPEDAGLIVRIFDESGFDVTGAIGCIDATEIDGKANQTLYEKFIQKPGTYTVYAYNDTHNSIGYDGIFVVNSVDVNLEKINGIDVSSQEFVWIGDDNVSATFSVEYSGVPVDGTLRIDNISVAGSGTNSYNKTWTNTSFIPVIGSTTGIDLGGNISKSYTVSNGVLIVNDITPDYLPDDLASRDITFCFQSSVSGSAWARSNGRVLVKMPDVSASPNVIPYNNPAELEIMVTGRGIPIENILVNLTIPGFSHDMWVRTDSEGKALFAFTPPTSGFISIKVENKTSPSTVIVIAQQPKAFITLYIEDVIRGENIAPRVFKAPGDFIDIVTVVKNNNDSIQNLEINIMLDNSTLYKCFIRDSFSDTDESNVLPFTKYPYFPIWYTDIDFDPYESIQVVWRFRLFDDIPKGINQTVVGAVFVDNQFCDYTTTSISISKFAKGIIVTNRHLLFDRYDDDEVKSLLLYLYYMAEDENCIVYYVDHYNDISPVDIMNWDQNVDFTNENTANVVSNEIDDLIEDWAEKSTLVITSFPGRKCKKYPYLVIIGSDEIVPFYRVDFTFYDEECYCTDDMPFRWDKFPYFELDEIYDCQDVVGNTCDFSIDPVLRTYCEDFFLTDLKYADLDDNDWTEGSINLASGRIVGSSAYDMENLIRNGISRPADDTNAIVATTWDEPVLIAGLEKLRDDKGLNILNDNQPSGETPETFNIEGWSANDLVNIMLNNDFCIFEHSHHGDYWVLDCPLGDLESDNVLKYDNDLIKNISDNRPFVTTDSCHTGVVTDRNGSSWDPDPGDNLAWALIHDGVSGYLAVTSFGWFHYSDVLQGDFYDNLIKSSPKQETNAVGDSLRNAIRGYNPRYFYWSNLDRVSLVDQQLYGIPWMTIDPNGQSNQQINENNEFKINISKPEYLGSDTYRRIIEINLTNYSILSENGFDIININGSDNIYEENRPIIPKVKIPLLLPLNSININVLELANNSSYIGNYNLPCFSPISKSEDGSYKCNCSESIGIYPETSNWWYESIQDYYMEIDVFSSLVKYDTDNKETFILNDIKLEVTYQTPITLIISEFVPKKIDYYSGEKINTSCLIENVGSDNLTNIQAELNLIDKYGEIKESIVTSPFSIDSGEEITSQIDIDQDLSDGTYLLQLNIIDSGTLASESEYIYISSGNIIAYNHPDKVIVGEDIEFEILFKNYMETSIEANGIIHLYDNHGNQFAHLSSSDVTIDPNSTESFIITWNTVDREFGKYTAVAIVNTTYESYGPLSNPFSIVPPDSKPPTTIKIIGVPKSGENDEWITSNTEFNLYAIDDLSGVNKTFYRIWYNDIWTSWMEYNSSFTLDGEGMHYLEYYSVDYAGNVEEMHNQTHYVDDTPPIISDLDDGIEGWSNDNTPTFTWTAMDMLSSIDVFIYRIDNGIEYITTVNQLTLPPQSNGIHTFYVKAIDAIENIGEFVSHEFYINAPLFVGGTGPLNYTSIQDAINDVSAEGYVMVYAGVYYENIIIDKNIILIGEDRNNTIIDGSNPVPGEFENVINTQYLNYTAKITGFTITNGSATNGGGMYNLYSSPTITNCIFYNNSATSYGGGIYNYHSSPTITNCIFYNNSASDHGGGMYNNYYSSPIISNCVFRNNSASQGGGIFATAFSELTITNNVFENNSAAAVFSRWYGDITLTGNIFTNNGGGIFLSNMEKGEIRDNTISGHQISIVVSGSKDVIITDNIAKNNFYDGIRLYASCSNVTVTNNEVFDNTWSGISIWDSNLNTINENTIYGSDMAGIVISNSDENVVMRNNIYENGNGVNIIRASTQNTVSLNQFSDNGIMGIYLDNVDGNIVSDNIVNPADECEVPAGLVSYWKMDEASGDTIYDETSNGNDGTIVDATWGDGRLDVGIVFDGEDDYIQIPYSTSLDFSDSDFSVSAWFKLRSGIPDYRYPIMGSGNPWGMGGKGYLVSIDCRRYSTDGFLAIRAMIGNGIGTTKLIPIILKDSANQYIDIRDNQWHHIAATFDRDDEANVYLDGRVIRTSNHDISGQQGGDPWTDDLIIGGYANLATFKNFNGSIDEVRVFNQALSSQEIHRQYLGGISIRDSDNNNVTRNIFNNSLFGIELYSSGYNNLWRNIIIKNTLGLTLDSSDDNTIYHNNLINNTIQLSSISSNNNWDNGLGEGNYWSDYLGVDDGSYGRLAGDNVGDTELPHQDVDNYPLMQPNGIVSNTNKNKIYSSIQECIDDADPGDVIKIGIGKYDEQLIINKSVTLIGVYNKTILQGENIVNSYGLRIKDTNNVTIENITIQDYYYGMLLGKSHYNTIINNVIDNNRFGIRLLYSHYNEIYYNVISNNYYGIYLNYSNNNTIENNTLIDNVYGIVDPFSNYNIIKRNYIHNNEYGIYVESSQGNIISDNSISENDYGVIIDENSYDNEIFYNNLIKNTVQAEDEGSNTWDDGSGTGNFWSDYTGEDTDGNGIGDTSYQELDQYPIIEPPANAPPVADADGPYFGAVDKQVTFNASDSYDYNEDDELKYRWDFDNDGVWDTEWSSNPISTCAWDDEYSGEVIVEVTDGDYSDTDTTTVTVRLVEATIIFDPETLNLLSQGNPVTVYIELPEDYYVEDINIGTLLLNGIVPAETWPWEIEDENENGIPDLMVKFNRSAVQGILKAGESESIVITGNLNVGTPFGGEDRIKVIKEA